MPNHGLGSPLAALALSGRDLYAGGFHINNTGDATVGHLGSIARCTLAIPEIQVLDGAADIPDGTGVVEFGTTPVGVPIEGTFTVHNIGTGDLTLDEPIAIPPGFSISSSFGASTLTPSKSTNFIIRFDAATPGMYSGTLEFGNNDQDENPFNFTVNGVVRTPEFEVYLPILLK
jgi:hypothetical protein